MELMLYQDHLPLMKEVRFVVVEVIGMKWKSYLKLHSLILILMLLWSLLLISTKLLMMNHGELRISD